MKNADPFVSLGMEPAVIKLGKYAKIIVRCGNGGNDLIVKNSMELNVAAPSNGRITSHIVDGRWKKIYLSKEKTGNTIILENIVDMQIPNGLSDVKLRVRGVKKGKEQLIVANISYNDVWNPALGKPNASQGNASNTNDNSVTSLTVI